MALLPITLRHHTDQRATAQELSLGGVRVRVRAVYVSATDRWVADLRELDDTLIVGGLVCVPGVDMLRPFKHLAIPQGELFCTSGDREPPTFATLGLTSQVRYRG